MSALNHAFSVFSFISFVLGSILFPWHFQARNAATCLYILWVSLSNLAAFVDSILWDGNVVNRSPVWCDISSRVILGCLVAIPATCLCIQRCIFHVLTDPLTMNTAAQKRRRVIWDLLIGLFVPLLSIVFAYFVQPFRYMIVEDSGCRIGFQNDTLSLILVPSFRLAISLLSGAYGCLNIYHVWTKRREVGSILDSSDGGPGNGYYIRLFMLSAIDIVITIPYNLWYFTTMFPLIAWPGWKEVHTDWSQILQIQAANGPLSTAWRYEVPRWMTVTFGLLFFVFFGVGAEARKHYASVWQYVSKVFGWQTVFFRKPPRSIHLSFAENPDKSDSQGSFHGNNGDSVAPSTASNADPRQEGFMFAPSSTPLGVASEAGVTTWVEGSEGRLD